MHGVYKYEVNGEVIYVGKTDSDFEARFACHGRESRFAPYLAEAKIFVHKTKDACEADFLETLLINQYKPQLNKAKKDLTSVEVCADLDWEPWDRYSKTKHRAKERIRRTHGLVRPSVFTKVTAYAKANSTSYNAIVCELLDEFIEKNGL